MKTPYLLFAALTLFSPSVYATADTRCTEMLHKLDSALQLQVPEISMLNTYVYESTKNTSRVIVYIYHCADLLAQDSISHDYYEMWVGSSSSVWSNEDKKYYQYDKPSKRFFSFYIKKDLSEILVYDSKKRTYIPVEKARQTENWKRTLDLKKQWVAANLK